MSDKRNLIEPAHVLALLNLMIRRWWRRERHIPIFVVEKKISPKSSVSCDACLSIGQSAV
jgi:hypothetical protein